MGDVVNLRLARKAAARRDREELADRNRIRHGRTKAEREAAKIESERTGTLLDGARREPSAD